MPADAKPSTRLCTHTTDAIFVRDRSLVDEVIGRMSFTEMIYLTTTGKAPGDMEIHVLDAVLVTLMEHAVPYAGKKP